MATPTDETKTTSLARRAPIEFIPSRAWHLYCEVIPFLAILTYDATLEQKNPCIRSQLGSSSLRLKCKVQIPCLGGLDSETIVENETAISFPYPTTFRKLLESHPQRQVLETININGYNQFSRLFLAIPGLSLLSYLASGLSYEAKTGPILDEENRQEPPAQEEDESKGVTHQRWGVRYSGFEFTRTSVIEREILIQPTYVTLGIFRRGQTNPQERIVFVTRPAMLFGELRWGIFRLRGLSSTLFSLRQVKSFRLYRCNHEEGTHERIHLDKNEAADLQVLLHMYKSWIVPNHIALAWAHWIHQTLNNSSLDVTNGSYAIEVVLDWSATRISIVILFPVLLSLAIGLWLNSAAWTDLATMQTAWGTASYVVTAGGLLAALLAIISSIANE